MQAKNPWSVEKLQNFIGQEETYHLEFKSSRGLLQTSSGEIDKTFNDLSSHISAFLNSEGGLLIIGIEESDKRDKKHAGKAVSLSDGIPRSQWIGDRVQSKLCDRIQPAVASHVLVHTVVIGKRETEDLLAFVIEVRQGITAYQASDKKYYSRRSYSSEPMDDKDVRLRMLSDNIPRVDLYIEAKDSPLNYSWEGYEDKLENYIQAKIRLKNRAETKPVLSEEEVIKKLSSGGFRIHPDAETMPPAWMEQGKVSIQVTAKNTGIVSIKKACIKYMMPAAIDDRIKLSVSDQEEDNERQYPYALRELDFSRPGKVMLYPDMKKLLFEFQIQFLRFSAGEFFKEDAEIVLYLDDGSPVSQTIDLNALLKQYMQSFEARLSGLQSKYPDIQIR